MLLIRCPWCGLRSESEFHCNGEVRPIRPHSSSLTDQQSVQHTCDRLNFKGWIEEDWCHSKGCGEWFRLNRNTVTHEIDQD